MGFTVAHKNSAIHYNRYGGGAAVLVCLHGYGETAGTFAFLAPLSGEKFTIIAIDLPFHGHTQWNEGLLFTPADLDAIVNAILLREQLHKSTDEIHLLGYSMGGRVALGYFQAYPHAVQKIALVAPDGLHTNRWYWFATQSALGNRLFKFTLRYPQWFLGMVKILARTGLLNKSVAKFVLYYLGDATIRTALYKRWTTMRRFTPNLPLIQQLATEYTVPIHMLFGQLDRIILPHRGEKLREGHEQLITVQVIKAGHQLLHEKYATAIAALLNA